MAISSTGVGSGLDVQSIVSQLVAVESRPVRLLQVKGNTLQTKMSVFGQIKSELSALKDAASALTDAATWSRVALTSSNAAITGSTTTGAQAATHSVSVTNLVQAQSLSSTAFTSGAQLGLSGNLTFYSGYRNTDGALVSSGVAGAPTGTVSVAATDTLANVVTKINAASLGVTASIVSTAGTQQLVVRGNSAGANAAFQISADPGLESFRYMPGNVIDPANPSTPVANQATSLADMTQGQAAKDATAIIDGITVTSTTNSISDALTGVTINLLAQTTSPAQVTVDLDKTSMKAKIQTFQDAYNKLYADLKAQTAYNASSKTGGPLLGDNTSIGMLSMLRNLVGASGPASSTLKRLSDLGLEIQSDGSLKTNTTKLDAALQTPVNVKEFFGASTGTSSSNGIAKRIYDFAFGALGVGGSVSSHSTAFQKSIDQNSATIEKFNSRIADYKKQLLAQYNTLDTNMAKLNSLSTYVSQQITMWNKSS